MNMKLPLTLLALLTLSIMLSSCSGTTVKTKDNYEMVELPDGSLVFLNHNSSIEFDEDFEERVVEAAGEFFFSVEEGATPFIVRTDNGQVTVVGTEFSVRTTDDELEVEVDEGVVELQANQLRQSVNSGEAAFFKDGAKVIRKAKAEFKFRIWMKDLKIEFRKLGRDFKGSSKQIRKESEKATKKLNKKRKSVNPDK